MAFLRFKSLKVNGMRNIVAGWSPKNVPFYMAHAILSEPEHVKVSETRERYSKMKQGILWWTCTANGSAKKVVRSWTKRRIKHAFRDVLAENGYDVNGATSKPWKKSLHGSLELVATEATVVMPYAQLKYQLDLILKALESKSNTDG